MKKIVIYKSSTGFTKQYATWISENLGCEMRDIKAVTADVVKEYDAVIYGGWIMGNMVVGLDKIREMQPKNLIVFGVGSSHKSDELTTAIMEQNHISEPFYYMEGGFHFEKLNFFIRLMLKTMKKSIAKKDIKTEQDSYMQEVLGTSFDHSDRTYTDELVAYVESGCC